MTSDADLTAGPSHVEVDISWAGGGLPVDTVARQLAPTFASMTAGTVEIVVNGRGYTVYYDEQPAIADSGRPAVGDVTGDFGIYRGTGGPLGLERLGDCHVSPHGTSGYGNPHAKAYAAEQVAATIARDVIRREDRSAR